jgi:hypothetical protein
MCSSVTAACPRSALIDGVNVDSAPERLQILETAAKQVRGGETMRAGRPRFVTVIASPSSTRSMIALT